MPARPIRSSSLPARVAGVAESRPAATAPQPAKLVARDAGRVLELLRRLVEPFRTPATVIPRRVRRPALLNDEGGPVVHRKPQNSSGIGEIQLPRQSG